jgi:ATP-dependent DNA helicase RecQ
MARGGARPARPRAGGGRAAHVSSTAGPIDPAEEALFERLRALRKDLADRHGVPANIVFSDKELREMAARRQGSPAELLGVSGVGPAKLERYGSAFLEEIERG